MQNKLLFLQDEHAAISTTVARSLVRRAAQSVSAFFSIVDAAYEATHQYQQLAQLAPGDLERRGVVCGDLNKHVFDILARQS